MSHRPTVSRCAVARVALAAGLLWLAGCGKAGSPSGEVSGRVTFEGKAVREGRITFMNTDTGTDGEAELSGEGTYTLPRPIPLGEYKVMVMPLVEFKQEGGKGPEVGIEKPAPDIPKKYRVIGTTDLKATVKEGKQELNFDMKR